MKIKSFLSSNKEIILLCFLLIIFFNQCNIRKKIAVISGNEKKQVTKIDSLIQVNSNLIRQDSINTVAYQAYIESLLLTMDNKQLNKQNYDLFKKYLYERNKNNNSNK